MISEHGTRLWSRKRWKWGPRKMPGQEKAADRPGRSRPFITLMIKKGSKLFEGRLPLARRKRGDGLEVDLDPVSFAALFASAGRLFTVDRVTKEIPKLRQAEKGDDDPEESSREGAA